MYPAMLPILFLEAIPLNEWIDVMEDAQMIFEMKVVRPFIAKQKQAAASRGRNWSR